MIADIRVIAKNGHRVWQQYSVDLWEGTSLPSQAYVMFSGGIRHNKPIRRGTKVYAGVIAAAREEVRRRRADEEG
jgi:hypothetical protein